MAVQVVSYLLLMNIILQQIFSCSYMKAEQHDLDAEKILQNFPTRLGRIKSYGKRPWPLIEQDSIAKRQSSSHLADNLLHSVSLLDHIMKWERTTRQLERMRSDDGPFQFSFTPNQLFNDNQ
ncbi:hypothetical protein T4A_10074 [Trichinella pseudospiralis]|uniref:Uncharacterized protein n=1 Tax=Trichinella pseudospiralis TaxID=6337 RepID=A0A0V0XTM6_TRIPS|nr:hypothetical protein T4E_7377 [Trichinella pseudospiralis]KRY72191.1 hypothetical protein T4A_10074 [Trichinella pseudospiralis]KRY90494.1 hypothetical protein T4D_6158 [Trichinella pseudospiralis]